MGLGYKEMISSDRNSRSIDSFKLLTARANPYLLIYLFVITFIELANVSLIAPGLFL